MKYEPAFFILMYIAIVGGGALCTSFESVLDFFVYLAIMLIFEGAICWFFYKVTKTGYEEKAALLAQCDAEGITLPELWEKSQGTQKAVENMDAENDICQDE